MPNASATRIRNALQESANPNLVGDASGRNDQGRGFLDVPAALRRLQMGQVRADLPDVRHGDDYSKDVEENLRELGIRTIEFEHDVYRTRVSNLLPGQVKQFYVDSKSSTEQLIVTLDNVTQELPPEQQNQLFGDDVFVQIVDAPTSFAALRDIAFVASEQTFTIDQPQTGLVRVALQGDWTNAGRVSADVTIRRVRNSLGRKTQSGRILQGQQIPVEVTVPAGTQEAVFDLHWKGNWGRYPTNDVDMLVVSPSGEVNVLGATFDSPERVVVPNPAPGVWTVVVDGFTIHAQDRSDDDGRPQKDQWTLYVTADGQVLRAN